MRGHASQAEIPGEEPIQFCGKPEGLQFVNTYLENQTFVKGHLKLANNLIKRSTGWNLKPGNFTLEMRHKFFQQGK